MALVALGAICAAVGIADNLINFSAPETWLLTGLVFGILAMAVAVDEQRLSKVPVRQPAEEWLARGIMAVSLACGLAGFGLGVFVDNESIRNLWSVMAVVLAIVSVSFAMDAHRVAVARQNQIKTEVNRDALAGVIAAALAFGLAVFGLFTGLFGLPHAEGWLFAAVVFAVISAAFMFDEQAHVINQARRSRHTPFAR